MRFSLSKILQKYKNPPYWPFQFMETVEATDLFPIWDQTLRSSSPNVVSLLSYLSIRIISCSLRFESFAVFSFKNNHPNSPKINSSKTLAKREQFFFTTSCLCLHQFDRHFSNPQALFSLIQRALEDWPGKLGTCSNSVCVFYCVLEPLETALQSRSMSKLTPGDQNSV